MLRLSTIAVLVLGMPTAIAVPLVLNDGLTHVVSGAPDGVVVYNASTALMIGGTNVNGDVVLARNPAPAPDGTPSSATFRSSGGTVQGSLTTGTDTYGNPQFATDLDVTLAGDTTVAGDVLLGAGRAVSGDINVTFADAVEIKGTVVIDRTMNYTGGAVNVSGGHFRGDFYAQSALLGIESVTISDGTFDGLVNLNDIGTAVVSGGDFRTMLNVGNGAAADSLQVTGGSFARLDSAATTTDIFGGTFYGSTRFGFGSGGDVNIYGGVFLDSPVFYFPGSVNIFGGDFSGSTWFVDLFLGSSLNFYGYDWSWNGSRLSGFLSDGNWLDTTLSGSFALNLFNVPSASVPEPGTFSLLTVGIMLLGMVSLRRRLIRI